MFEEMTKFSKHEFFPTIASNDLHAVGDEVSFDMAGWGGKVAF